MQYNYTDPFLEEDLFERSSLEESDFYSFSPELFFEQYDLTMEDFVSRSTHFFPLETVFFCHISFFFS